MYTRNEQIVPIAIEQEMKDSYISYAMSVIVGRALPDARDGLKPVQRRILYSMRELGLDPGKPYKKAARIVGETLGKYHPHGDMAVYDALVRMAQDFSVRYPLVDGQGNFGCFTGDTKVKLLDGRDLSFKELAQEFGPDRPFYVYSIDREGHVTVGVGQNPRMTRQKARLVDLTLDSGETIRCTPDHRFMLRDGSYKQAKDLSEQDSLMPGCFRTAPVKEELNDYLQMLEPSTGQYEFVHRMVDRWMEGKGLARRMRGPFVRHHKNFDRFDNRPENLVRMRFLEHLHVHAEQLGELWGQEAFRERQWEDQGFRQIQGEAVRARNLRRIAADPQVMHRLAGRAAEILRKRWQSEEYRRRVIRSKILRYAKGLLSQFPRNTITQEVYDQHRRNHCPRSTRLPEYFSGFDEMLDQAEVYNHRVVEKRFLEERADVWDITVEEHHNFLLSAGVFVHNSIDGDAPAAMRYVEARLAPIAEMLLNDIDKETVDFAPNFDESLQEPRVLPSALPTLLANGASGIAVGMATNIPPHQKAMFARLVLRSPKSTPPLQQRKFRNGPGVLDLQGILPCRH